MNGKPKSYRSLTAMSELYARYDYLMAIEATRLATGRENPRRGAGLAPRTLQCDSLQGAAHRDAGQALAQSRWPSTLRDPRRCWATPLGPAPPESSATGPAPVRQSGWQG